MHSLHAGADGEFAEELRYSQRAEAAARQAGDAGLLARVLAGRAAPLVDMGQFVEAERVCREVIDWAHGQDVVGDALFAVFSLAELLWRRGALEEAADLLGGGAPGGGGPAGGAGPAFGGHAARDGRAGPRRRGRRTRASAGGAAFADGSRLPRPGVRHLERGRGALRHRRGAADRRPAVRGGAGRPGRACVRPRASTAATGRSSRPQLRAVLGDAAFDDAYGEGAELGLDEAAALALDVEHPDLAADSTRFSTGLSQPTPRRPADPDRHPATRTERA